MPRFLLIFLLLLSENFDFSNVRSFSRKVKGMLRDLKDQATISDLSPVVLEGGPSGEFRAVLSGALDLFNSEGACQMLPCRVGYAQQIARSIALMSDTVTIHDYFYERILDLRTRATHKELFPLLCDIVVLKKLQPLIEAGVLRFSLPFMGSCSSCMSEFERRVGSLGSQVLENLGEKILVQRSDQGVAVELGSMYNPAVVMRVKQSFASEKSDTELAEYFVHRAVRSIMWDARSASWIGGSVFSNSPAGVSALLSEEGMSFRTPELRAFATDRAANLPWVAGLSIPQTLALRNEASSALPALREFMARRISATPDGEHSASWQDCIAELREQAQQVRTELSIATSRSRALQRNATGILGLTVSAVCLAAEGPVSAESGLLGTLGLIHSLPAMDSIHAKTIKTKPGYVLVAAEDILQHATQ